ncbi:MAG: LysM peptidoglycan-binding domain-containing protein, partial [Candidatus Rokubacteria bacterium]|nr:LysM peptidoglycan-binding domain-containing protein [Candidatus Rokubacteria bacterium]
MAAGHSALRRIRDPVRGVRAVRGRARGVALGLLALLAPALDGHAVADPVPARAPARVHEVRQGDTLEAVARRYGVTVAAIVAANR